MPSNVAPLGSPYDVMMSTAEKRMIQEALDGCGSHRAAARLLGVTETFLMRRCFRLGMPIPRTRRSIKATRQARGPDGSFAASPK